MDAAEAAARRRAASGRREKALNACLLFTNVFYIATAIAILSIGMAVLQEHVDDLKANVFNDYEVLGKPQPTPCSLPTPDAMRLLQSLGAVPDGGLEASVLEPDYVSWIASIRDNMCFRKIIGVPNPSFGASDALCGNGSSGAYADSADYAEELLALSGILDDASFSPVDADLAASDLRAKLDIFNSRACLTKREAGVDPFYQQLRSYGDLKVRAMRAYLAAMPSFFHYAQVQTTCWHSAVADPFTTLCMHACHVEAELGRAAGDLRFLVRDGDPYNPRMPEWADGVPLELPKVLYRLLALSVVGHYDRYYNEGRCFRNADSGGAPYSNASSFCAAVLSTAELHEDVSDPADPMGSYGAQQQVVHDDYGCARGSSPPPPAPPNTHAAADAHAPDDDLAALYHAVCASTLEYGLFEQGRLFGIQDPTGPFVVDNRGAPDALALLFGSVVYDLLYVHQNVGERFKEPKARLELYMAYRLAGTAVWGTLAAAVCGYMLFRAIVPTLVVATRCLGLKGLDGRPVTLRRPQADVPVYLAVFSTLLAGYWMVYIDPATQSHYPRTTDCSEFLGSDTQISTSVYVTTWSKRRFDRAGEQQLGILLWVLAFLFAFHQTVGKFCTDRTRVEDARDARDARDGAPPEPPKWADNDRRLFWIIFLFNVVNVVAFAGTASSTGREWYDDAAFPMDTTEKGDLLARDCIGTIYAAFWAGATVAVVRQQWAVFMLPLKAKILWAATVVLLAWMPALQSDVLFNEEWTGYFDSENKYVGRRAQIVVSIANGVVGTTGVLILLQCARRRAKRAKAKIQAAAAAAAAATAKKRRRNAVTASSHFSVNFTDAQLLLGDDGAGFTMGPEEPLLFGRLKQKTPRYMPMLGL